MSDSTWKLVVASCLEKLNATLPAHIREVDKHEPTFGHVPPRGQSICKLINPSKTPQMSDLHRLVRPAPPSDRVSCSEKPNLHDWKATMGKITRAPDFVALYLCDAFHNSGSYRFGPCEEGSIG